MEGSLAQFPFSYLVYDSSVPMIGMSFTTFAENIMLFWTADGISTEPPSSGGSDK